ncbi:unnamed protein product, partial [Mesorhabditis belari]|uniref:UPAR/Ly6 domain-containing protein n=1 Tax=Mesorhabditis belari TaxID=2138241 RepID=A0AAF3F2F2_9BILA
MRILLILTSLMSGIWSIECWVDSRETVGKEHTEKMSNTSCDSGCNFCVKWQGSNGDLKGTYWGCGCGKTKRYQDLADCKTIGKRSEQIGEGTNIATKIYVWCCKKDYCNSSKFISHLFSFILTVSFANLLQ